jgi:dipeptidyl aminopeptidase/acylaminoacyl peptidase
MRFPGTFQVSRTSPAMPKAVVPYGSWKSEISSDLVVADAVSLSEVRLADGAIYWLEGRPKEGGRSVVIRRRTGEAQQTDLNPPPFNVRTRVHEYGGGAWTVFEGSLYFSNDAPSADGVFPDRQLYRFGPGDRDPVALTERGPWRYADGLIDDVRKRWIGVREDHSTKTPVNSIVAVDLDATGSGTPIIEGNDFYASPRLSPDGKWLAWITWNLPAMPWNECSLVIAAVGPSGEVRPGAVIAGGNSESVIQPEWLPDSSGLIFISDRSGWWNLYRYDLQSSQTVALWPLDAEFAQPQFLLGMSSYAFAGDDRIVCALIRNGLAELAELDMRTGASRLIPTPYTEIGSMRAAGNKVVFRGGASDLPTSIVALDLGSHDIEVVARATPVLDDPAIRRHISLGRPIEFETTDNQTSHGFYYPPTNPSYEAPAGEKPPLLVRCHGGPTAAASPALDLRIQFWTSRGIAFLDLNYRGSTGFGRAYRDLLRGNWGKLDVDDAEAAARHLAKEGLANPHRMAITGGSAGGLTVLSALAFRHVFAGGASYFGVSDLARLARDTHKFESKYLDWLIAPYPEGKDLYSERSPVDHADKVSAPVIFFQGDEDQVVPPDQTERMVAALRASGITACYLLFSGEQHGFRKAENIKRALDAELYFYAANVFKIALVF